MPIYFKCMYCSRAIVSFLKINLLLCCSRGGAGDCSSCVGVMLELARGVSQWAHGFKSGVLFLFNTGEEEGLDGAHSFITQVTTFIHHNKPCCNWCMAHVTVAILYNVIYWYLCSTTGETQYVSLLIWKLWVSVGNPHFFRLGSKFAVFLSFQKLCLHLQL
jgi:Zn-dependent M28 family amino/carboxypeptidase